MFYSESRLFKYFLLNYSYQIRKYRALSNVPVLGG
jgi:hypothetical protein